MYGFAELIAASKATDDAIEMISYYSTKHIKDQHSFREATLKTF